MSTIIKKFIDHNAAILQSICLCSAALLWFYGCEAKTTSLVSPNVKVTRAELENEVSTLAAQAEAKFADLERQEILRQAIAETLAVQAKSGTVNPTGVMTLVLSILSIGAVATYRKKDTVIKTLKNNANSKNPAPS